MHLMDVTLGKHKEETETYKVMLKNQKYINKFFEKETTKTYQMSNLKFCKDLFAMSMDIVYGH